MIRVNDRDKYYSNQGLLPRHLSQRFVGHRDPLIFYSYQIDDPHQACRGRQYDSHILAVQNLNQKPPCYRHHLSDNFQGMGFLQKVLIFPAQIIQVCSLCRMMCRSRSLVRLVRGILRRVKACLALFCSQKLPRWEDCQSVLLQAF